MILTKGSHVYFVDPLASGGPALQRLACVTAVELGGAPKNAIDDTCLDDTSVTKSVPGLGAPDEASFSVNLDGDKEGHYEIYNLSIADGSAALDTQFIVLLSDGTSAPTLNSAGVIVPPTDRSSFTYTGYVTNCPPSIALNDSIKATISVQKTSVVTWTKKA